MTELRKVTQLAWRRFLATPEGQEGMLLLRERMPDVRKSDADGIIFDAGVAQGYRKALDFLSEYIAQKPSQSQDIENP